MSTSYAVMRPQTLDELIVRGINTAQSYKQKEEEYEKTLDELRHLFNRSIFQARISSQSNTLLELLNINPDEIQEPNDEIHSDFYVTGHTSFNGTEIRLIIGNGTNEQLILYMSTRIGQHIVDTSTTYNTAQEGIAALTKTTEKLIRKTIAKEEELAAEEKRQAALAATAEQYTAAAAAVQQIAQTFLDRLSTATAEANAIIDQAIAEHWQPWEAWGINFTFDQPGTSNGDPYIDYEISLDPPSFVQEGKPVRLVQSSGYIEETFIYNMLQAKRVTFEAHQDDDRIQYHQYFRVQLPNGLYRYINIPPGIEFTPPKFEQLDWDEYAQPAIDSWLDQNEQISTEIINGQPTEVREQTIAILIGHKTPEDIIEMELADLTQYLQNNGPQNYDSIPF